MENKTQSYDKTIDELDALVDQSAAKNARAAEAANILKTAPQAQNPTLQAHINQALALLTQET